MYSTLAMLGAGKLNFVMRKYMVQSKDD